MNPLEQLVHGGGFRRASGADGGEFHGPGCPECGHGEDRLVVNPFKGPTGRWWCRACRAGGDGLDYVRKVHGVSFREAEQMCGLPPKRLSGSPAVRSRTSPGTASGSPTPRWTPRALVPPNPDWQREAKAFVYHCWEALKTDPVGMAYAASRGLTPETCLLYRLGWNANDALVSGKPWGVGGALDLPNGLVLPAWRDNDIIKVKIRRPNPTEKQPKYHQVKGGSSAPLRLGGRPGGPVVVVEGEIDALLIAQALGDAAREVAVVALGSATNRPDAALQHMLLSASRIVVIGDRDDAGRKMVEDWSKDYSSVKAVFPPSGFKDVGDMAAAGVDLRAMLSSLLQGQTSPPPHPVAVPAAPSPTAPTPADAQPLDTPTLANQTRDDEPLVPGFSAVDSKHVQRIVDAFDATIIPFPAPKPGRARNPAPAMTDADRLFLRLVELANHCHRVGDHPAFWSNLSFAAEVAAGRGLDAAAENAVNEENRLGVSHG